MSEMCLGLSDYHSLVFTDREPLVGEWVREKHLTNLKIINWAKNNATGWIPRP